MFRAFERVKIKTSKTTCHNRPTDKSTGATRESAGLPGGKVKELGSENHQELEVEFIAGDRSAGIEAIEKAQELFGPDVSGYCIFGGIDSFLNSETLKWLEENRKLKCSGNNDGFIPGEGAGFCLLTNEKGLTEGQLKPLAQIIGVSKDDETQNPDGAPTMGRALSGAVADVLKFLPEGQLVDQNYCTLTGQRSIADEYGFTTLRQGKKMADPGGCISTISCWGDVGVASIPLFVGLATQAAIKGYAKGKFNLLMSSSILGEKGAALIELTSIEERRKWL